MSHRFLNIPLSFFVLLLFGMMGFFHSPNPVVEEEYNPLPCINKEFPIAIQIMRDSFELLSVDIANIEASVDALNELFEPICASFRITDTRIIENEFFDLNAFSGDIYQSMVATYNKPHRINIYIGKQVSGGAYTLSRATFEGIAQDPFTYPSIGVNKDVFLGTDVDKHLAHAVGLYFGLLPTSSEGTELADGSNCDTTGDNICDTPADPFNPVLTGDEVFGYTDGCRFNYPDKDANDEFYNPDISNIMSYYTECRCVFSQDQYKHMANTYLDNPGNTW